MCQSEKLYCCRACNKPLICPDNWSPSFKQNNQYICKDCKNKKLKEWRDRNPDAWMKWKYGVSQEEYDCKLKDQGYKCGICRTTKPGGRWDSWHIDHDHETGAFRGLLCWNCNRGLGSFQDSVGNLLSAVKYLERNNED